MLLNEQTRLSAKIRVQFACDSVNKNALIKKNILTGSHQHTEEKKSRIVQ